VINTFCGSVGFCVTHLMYTLNSEHSVLGMKTRGKKEERIKGNNGKFYIHVMKS